MLLIAYISEAVTRKLRGITMTDPNTSPTPAVPFFARFLLADQEETPTPDDSTPTPPPVWTFKWPSDWEDS